MSLPEQQGCSRASNLPQAPKAKGLYYVKCGSSIDFRSLGDKTESKQKGLAIGTIGCVPLAFHIRGKNIGKMQACGSRQLNFLNAHSWFLYIPQLQLTTKTLCEYHKVPQDRGNICPIAVPCYEGWLPLSHCNYLHTALSYSAALQCPDFGDLPLPFTFFFQF